MSTEIVLPVVVIGAIFLIAAMLGGISLAKARVTGMKEEDFQQLSQTQKEIAEGVAELRGKVAAIEKMLREVE